MIRPKERPSSLVLPIALIFYATILLPAETLAKQPKNILFFAGIGWTAGGDTFDVDPTDTRQNSSSGLLNLDNQLSAGGDVHVWFGTIWIHNRYTETFFAIGYHNDANTFQDNSSGRTGSSNFGQITYDIVPTYRVANFRFGTGISYHTNIRHSETITTTISNTTATTTTTATKKIQYDDALGTVVSIGYDFSQHGRIDLRYQFIEYVSYEQSALLNQKLNGDSVGLYVYVTF